MLRSSAGLLGLPLSRKSLQSEREAKRGESGECKPRRTQAPSTRRTGKPFGGVLSHRRQPSAVAGRASRGTRSGGPNFVSTSSANFLPLPTPFAALASRIPSTLEQKEKKRRTLLPDRQLAQRVAEQWKAATPSGWRRPAKSPRQLDPLLRVQPMYLFLSLYLSVPANLESLFYF